MAARTVGVLTEDTYAREFVRGLVSRLRAEGVLSGPSASLVVQRYAGVCNAKSGRQVRVLLEVRGCDLVITPVDAHGRRVSEVEGDVRSHVDARLRSRVRVVVCRRCIEEWLAAGYGLPSSDPLEEVRSFFLKKRGSPYEKRELPRLAGDENLRVDRMLSCESFRQFVEALREALRA